MRPLQTQSVALYGTALHNADFANSLQLSAEALWVRLTPEERGALPAGRERYFPGEALDLIAKRHKLSVRLTDTGYIIHDKGVKKTWNGFMPTGALMNPRGVKEALESFMRDAGLPASFIIDWWVAFEDLE